MRQIFHSGYCYVLPNEEERELVKEYIDEEHLKLGFDRIPALGDIRYYDRFDRYGEVVAKHHFIVEEVEDLDVIEIKRHSGYDDDSGWKEIGEATIKVKYKVSVFKEKNPALWEEPQKISDVV